MINKATRDLLLKIVTEKMIPEYERSKKLKLEIRDLFIECLDKYIGDDEKRLIKKHPEFIKKTKEVQLFSYYQVPKDIKLDYKAGGTYDERQEALRLDLGCEVLKICSTLLDLQETYPVIWKKLKPKIQSYCCVRNSYIEKYNTAYKALNHKNLTITMLKKEFPELYKLYQDYGR